MRKAVLRGNFTFQNIRDNLSPRDPQYHIRVIRIKNYTVDEDKKEEENSPSSPSYVPVTLHPWKQTTPRFQAPSPLLSRFLKLCTKRLPVFLTNLTPPHPPSNAMLIPYISTRNCTIIFKQHWNGACFSVSILRFQHQKFLVLHLLSFLA